MDSIPQKELRNQVSEVLRRVEAGESLLVTVAGRPVAELTPTAPRRWVGGEALAAVWDSPTPKEMADDLALMPGALVDPYVR